MKVMIYIISLCNKTHGGEIYMFQNERFCTCGVNEEVPIVLQCMMWNMIDTMEVESKDYLQVFELSEYDGMQKIVHSQEMPEYKMEYLIKLQGAPIFVGKIYVIDDKITFDNAESRGILRGGRKMKEEKYTCRHMSRKDMTYQN